MAEPLREGDPTRFGQYELHARLGAGGMGQVYLGRSPGGRLVAVKVVRPELSGDAAFRRRFADEVMAARKVGGFYTAPVIDADTGADPPWLATAYIPGPSLHQAITERGPLNPDSVAALGAGLAEGLVAVHASGIVHRDLKPANVVLGEDGPRVIDFGIARVLDNTSFTKPSTVLGTAAFTSPEQARAQPVGPASDVFSLGCVLVFAMTGHSPFGEGPAHAVLFRVVHEKPDLSGLRGPVGGMVAECLAKDPGARIHLDKLRDVLAILAPRAPASTGEWWPGDDLTEVIAQHTTRLYTLIDTDRTRSPGEKERESAGSRGGRDSGRAARTDQADLVIGNLGPDELEIVMDGAVLGTVPEGTSQAFKIGAGAHAVQARVGTLSGTQRQVTVGPRGAAVTFDTTKRRSPPEPVETVTFTASKISDGLGIGASAVLVCVILGLVIAALVPTQYPPHPVAGLPQFLLLGSPLLGLALGAVEYLRPAPWLTFDRNGLSWRDRAGGEAQRVAWADVDRVRLVGSAGDTSVVVWPGKGRSRPRGEPFQGGVIVCKAKDVHAVLNRKAHRLRACLEWFPEQAK